MKYGGYVGKILRVDLSTGKISTLDTGRYVPDCIGGIALGYQLLWDEVNEKTTEWSPENALIFATGPCTGTPAPTAGRAEVIGIAPQGYPIPWAAQSGFGGDFGPKLKWAGYDAIVIVGKAASPKYLYISDEKVEIRDGKFLWGMSTFTTQDTLARKHGDDVSVACIGPAGENRVRWSVILSRDENAAGQGGFGALMGDKKLKAIVVKPGRTKVRVADPAQLIEDMVRISYEISPAGQHELPIVEDKDRFGVRHASCAFSCCTAGAQPLYDLPRYYSKVPRKYTGVGSVSGTCYCVGTVSAWLLDNDFSQVERMVEFNKLCDELGLNVWEMFAGMGWFMQNAYHAGRLTKLLGEPIKLNPKGPAVYPKTDRSVGMTPEFAVKFIRAVAYREGEGDIWAEGTPRAAEKLGLADLTWKTHKHGYAPHWDGRYLQHVHSPVWIVSALGWATQGRDPYNQQHGYVERYTSHITEWAPFGEGKGQPGFPSWFGDETISYREACEAGAKIYGARYANEGWDKPELAYVDKEYVATWHERRAIMKSSIPVCDRQFPLLFDAKKPNKIGDIEAEVRLFNAVVGTNWSLDDMHKACERAFNVVRALHVRQGRTRAHDESVIPYFTQPANYPDEPGSQVIDIPRFKKLLDNYYKLHGWDPTTGWPTKAKLEECGLGNIARELARLGKLPR